MPDEVVNASRNSAFTGDFIVINKTRPNTKRQKPTVANISPTTVCKFNSTEDVSAICGRNMLLSHAKAGLLKLGYY